jgi:carboxypeptidase C (cathepsin A)
MPHSNAAVRLSASNLFSVRNVRLLAGLTAIAVLACAGSPASARESTASSMLRPASGPGSASAPKTAWPKPVSTEHTITIGGKALRFTATAGYITLRNSETLKPIADIAYQAFTLKDRDAATRPVTFAFNGGPGYASAWLNLGALGPWRLNMDAAAAVPSAPPKLADNQESWLPFTDLVFIDPAGTGYGRLHDKEARSSLWSVDGDINSLATTIRRWVQDNGRTASPKYLLGESYGGFRVPKIAHELQTDQGLGVNGLIMVSPVLDFARRRSSGPLSYAAPLPSMAATALSARSGAAKVTREDVAGVEDFARSAFLVDLVRGRSDREAVKRLVERVTEITGLDRAIVARHAGRISTSTFIREIYRTKGQVPSIYDGLVKGLDPDRYSNDNEAEDQMRLGLHAPIVQAMTGMYRNKLKWVYPDGRYMFQNKQAGRTWKWGRRSPEAVSALASTMALDPNMKVLVVHGLTDLATPYFETRMVLDDMAPIGKTLETKAGAGVVASPKGRVKFQVYRGGHMFYSLDASRKAFRDDGRAIIDAGKDPKG